MATQVTAPTFLGLTATPFGVLAAFSDGRIAQVLDIDGEVTLRPYAHADYAALWPAVEVAANAVGTWREGDTLLWVCRCKGLWQLNHDHYQHCTDCKTDRPPFPAVDEPPATTRAD